MPKFPKNTSPAMYKSSGFKMKNSALHKSAKYGSPMQGTFDKVKEAAKEIYEKTMPKVLQDVNKKIYDKVKGGKSKEGSKVVNFSEKNKNYDIKFVKPKTKTKTKEQTEIERYENDHINKKTGESLFKYKKSPAKKPTDRKEKIAKNIEFNKVAEQKGLKPPRPKAGDAKALKAYEKFYSNKANVNMLNKKQKEYFKNKK